MGFMMTGLGVHDRGTISQLQPEIIQTLRKASDRVRRGTADGECLKWFGDDSANWKSALQQDLNRMASIINTTPISISFRKLSQRNSDENATAWPPRGDFHRYASLNEAQNRNFSITLNQGWNTLPLYRPFKRPVQSKFQTLVHESSHLLLDTYDFAYQPLAAEMLASSQPDRAKRNAENWGFFVEEFR